MTVKTCRPPKPIKSLLIVLGLYEMIHLMISTSTIVYHHSQVYTGDIRIFGAIDRNLTVDSYNASHINVSLILTRNITTYNRTNEIVEHHTNASHVHKRKRSVRLVHGSSMGRYKSYISAICKEEYKRHHTVNNVNPALCPCISPHLHGRVIPNITDLMEITWPKVRSQISNTLGGGRWRPEGCIARRRVAVIIPCRDRERHLRAWLAHTHHILQRQLIEYQVFVVEQELPYTFNKGSMMNVGFIEAMREFKPDCVLFHDVDLLMENDLHLVACGKRVQHMAAYIDKHQYRIKYLTLLGGAVLLKSETFHNMNGFSNKYFGWGGEDDDFQHRLRWQNLTMYRAPRDIASYSMIRHVKDIANPRARDRGKYRKFSSNIYKGDGISNVKYTIVDRHDFPLYTWIHVRLPRTPARFSLRKPIDFDVRQVTCLDANVTTNRNIYPLSTVTCRHICMEEQKHDCVGFLYVRNNVTDSYCKILSEKCDKTKASNTEEIHMKRYRS